MVISPSSKMPNFLSAVFIKKQFGKYKSHNSQTDKVRQTSWGWAVPSSVKLEVIVEVVVKVSSWSRGHSVLVRMGGWVVGKTKIMQCHLLSEVGVEVEDELNKK